MVHGIPIRLTGSLELVTKIIALTLRHPYFVQNLLGQEYFPEIWMVNLTHIHVL